MMKKEDVLAKMAQDAGITRKAASTALNSFLEGVTESLGKGEKLSLIGFGTFEVRTRRARKGINPKTRKPLNIPAKQAPAFRPGKKLKDAVK